MKMSVTFWCLTGSDIALHHWGVLVVAVLATGSLPVQPLLSKLYPLANNDWASFIIILIMSEWADNGHLYPLFWHTGQLYLSLLTHRSSVPLSSVKHRSPFSSLLGHNPLLWVECTGYKSNQDVFLWYSYDHQYQTVASRSLGANPNDMQEYVFLYRLVNY